MTIIWECYFNVANFLLRSRSIWCTIVPNHISTGWQLRIFFTSLISVVNTLSCPALITNVSAFSYSNCCCFNWITISITLNIYPNFLFIYRSVWISYYNNTSSPACLRSIWNESISPSKCSPSLFISIQNTFSSITRIAHILSNISILNIWL